MNDHKNVDLGLGISECDAALLKAYSAQYDALLESMLFINNYDAPFTNNQQSATYVRARQSRKCPAVFVRGEAWKRSPQSAAISLR
jgi:hypothetical protein